MLRLRWIIARNRLLASARFQRFATAFPLTRPVAHARARALFDVVGGFVYAQIAFACVELKLLDRLAEGPASVETLAGRLELPVASTATLLKAAAALGFTQAVGDVYALGPQGAALLGNGGIAEMIAHHRHLYADLADPVALLRRGGGGGALADYWAYADASAPKVAGYSALMAASQAMIAEQVIDAYPFARHSRLLDVGGGEGAFLGALAERVPGLALDLFDLPAVAERAAARLGARATIHPGSFREDPLPRGPDIISLVRILHDHDDPIVAALLSSVHAALPPGGTIVAAEPMAATRGAEPIGHAYFGFYLLAMGSGRPRTASELKAMLRAAGFDSPREHRTRTPLTVRVISARKSRL